MSRYRPMATHLSTDRLTLRPWAASDADDYHALVAERDAPTPTIDEIRERIAAALARSAESGIALLPVVRRAEGDFIGYCGLTVGRATIEEPEIAYELFRRAHGRGYATEAATAVLGAAADTGRSRLWATVGTWNAPSFRVLEKLGFARDRVSSDERGEFVWLARELPASTS